jgi:XTP/dITP diphosphohydrolase
MRHALVVATGNRGKLEEIRLLLEDLELDVLALGDVVKRELHIVEDGATFEENALKKAQAVVRATGMLTLADDSGLEVDALGGAPGVHSARYAGERATDAENNAALLAALGSQGRDATGAQSHPAFAARFRCVLTLVDPFTNDGAPYVVDGACEGRITQTPRGSGGFGYDPLFLVEGTDLTMAELPDVEKNRVSHRGRAMAKLRLVLEKILAQREAVTRKIAGEA